MTVDLSGLQPWLNDPSAPVGRDAFRRCGRVVSRGKVIAPVDQGRLRAAIHVDPVPKIGPTSIAWDAVCNVRYARVVHDGRRPGARMPPSGALEVWARRHGAPGAGFVIARSIAQRGIPGRPFLVDALPAALV